MVDALQLDTACDRSVQGTIRVAAQDIDAMLMDPGNIKDLPIYTLSARLCNRPVPTKGMKSSEYLWPHKTMKDFLQEITGVSTSGVF